MHVVDSDSVRVYGVAGKLKSEAGGYHVLFVVQADSSEAATLQVLKKEPRVSEIQATYLGLVGTDSLSHAEDKWALKYVDKFLLSGLALGVPA